VRGVSARRRVAIVEEACVCILKTVAALNWFVVGVPSSGESCTSG
jgi:hypothetical protein